MVTTEASSKIAGYNFQFQRALYRLFSSESAETTVGIETDDDVVEITRDANGLVGKTLRASLKIRHTGEGRCPVN